MDNWNDSWWFKTLLFVALAFFGGSLGYVMRTKEKEQSIKWGRMLLEGFAAGFVGLLFMFVCNEMHMSDKWTGVIVGVAGWLGAGASIRVLEVLVYKKLGLIKKSNSGDKDAKDSTTDTLR